MPKSHEKFYSENGKRLILVADDEAINRELLKAILEEEYELLFAEDGSEAMEIINEKKEVLSLVLLDLMMPKVPGMEVLKWLKENEETSQIPVIVLTADQTAEIEALGHGAIDFIPKPYPAAGVIKARIWRTIELSEDRHIIQITERDPLTGLYNKEYYYQYADQYDQYHRDKEMDAIVIDINHFHMINERYGKAYADGVLKRIGQKLREMVSDSGGIVCRREADTFLVYCPHREDYEAILENATEGLSGEDAANSRVRMRMGVYSGVDKSLEIERRFDRAKMAADTVKDSFDRAIGIYDNTMNETEVYAEQLLEDFHTAIKEKQFRVFYQPKFNIRTEIPVLASAEALIRWIHPKLGMISPGVFIPLFEKNGLIRELDTYVWQETAKQINLWKQKYRFSVPVSVNVSRVDMYDPNLIGQLTGIIRENGLTTEDFYLEITESAYTQDSEQIIAVVNELRRLGFKIEMDDFGTGYSSLNMISALPIDALKLDMQFIRNAFRGDKDTRMIEIIIDIADYLSVPVIAEGVENEEQFRALRLMGCDIVQGFYFSRPVPVEEYEPFLIEREKRGEVDPDEEEVTTVHPHKHESDTMTFGKIAHALAAGFESIYYVNLENGHYIEFNSHGDFENLQIRRSGEDFFADAVKNISRFVYEKDQMRVSLSLDKETLLSELIGIQSFSITFRVAADGSPVYYNMKAVRAKTKDDLHIVLGISNVHDQVTREKEEFAKELEEAKRFAECDALTGVRNKNAFVLAEEEINRLIASGSMPAFAVAICDLNSLKEVNDTLGHKAGDHYIKDACSMICEIFKHSPVFRIGGDEFAVILKGQDYENRAELGRRICETVNENIRTGEVVVAYGCAEYRDGDRSIEEVFDRADRAMYRNKKELKKGTENKESGGQL